MKTVDVIIPAYNSAETLDSTVHSIQHSGLKDFSIIIVDDGSTDQTKQVCEKLAKQYSNIQYIYQKNTGVSGARNRGLNASNAQYVFFFDSDDYVDAGSLAPVSDTLTEKQPDLLIFGMIFDYYHKGKVYRSDTLCYPVEACYSADTIGSCFADLYAHNALTSACNKIFRRQLLINNDISFSESLFLLEDFLFTLNCIKHCASIYTFPAPIYRYRQTEDEGNLHRRLQRIDDLVAFLNNFQDGLTDHPEIFSNLYYMLLHQKLFSSSLSEIRSISQLHLSGNIMPTNAKDAQLDTLLKENRCIEVYFRNKATQIRHKIAVPVKAFFQKVIG